MLLASIENAIDRAEAPRFATWTIWAAAAAMALAASFLLWPSSTTKNPPSALVATETPVKPAPEPLVIPDETDESEAATTASIPAVATDYTIRLQGQVRLADEAALRGSQLMADGDYQGAIDQYRAALDLLPDAPMTEPRRRAYVKQFSRASTLLATQRAEEGRYPESIALVEEVLQPSIDPDSIDAKRLLERLNDPDYYSPALTPQHLERIRRLKLAMKTAQGYRDIGDYDRADREFHKALNTDPYNVAARRGLEKNERHRLDYYDQSYNHTRTRFLREIAAGWESPVPAGIEGGPIVETVSSARYGAIADNSWSDPVSSPLSTFSIDVDTAAWTTVRHLIRDGRNAAQIPDDAVRIEEMINYFDWNYPQPEGEHPFAFAVEQSASPWNPDNRLLRVGIQGAAPEGNERPSANLVFLVDVSGSMDQPEKLPLVKESLRLFSRSLGEDDRVAMVVYAGSEGLALPSVPGSEREAIEEAITNLAAGGSTNGGAGIELAYRIAREQFREGETNRVVLCTDGDFNVGLSQTESLVELVEREAESGVFLTVCGFGTDNLNDEMMEQITNRGNGNYFHVDSLREARKVFLRDLTANLVAIAKDVKIQIEFNPAKVRSYRLIGYTNRMLKDEDFRDDEVDAGEVGAGHQVTALYEIVPADGKSRVDDLRYQTNPVQPAADETGELAFLRLRYKQPESDTSVPVEFPIASLQENAEPSEDFRFASAVALFGMVLREDSAVAGATLDRVVEIASDAIGADPHGDRTEFVDLVRELAQRQQVR